MFRCNRHVDGPEPRTGCRLDLRSVAFAACLLAIYGLGVYHRTVRMCAPNLSKDALWTLRYSVPLPVGEIFRDLASPNNHPLSTLLIKGAMLLFGRTNFAVRLFAWLPGLGIPLAAAGLAYALFLRKRVALLTLALCSFNGALVFYSGAARGYALQTLLLVLFALAAVCHEGAQGPSSQRQRGLCRALLVLCPLAAALTLTPSILFIVPLAACHLVWLWHVERSRCPEAKAARIIRRGAVRHRDLLLAYAVLLLALAAWYGGNARSIALGRGHGTVVAGGGSLVVFAGRALVELLGRSCLFASCLVFVRGRRNRLYGVACLALVAFSLGSAIVVNGGPARVYTPLIPFLCIAAACGVDSLLCWTETRLSHPRPTTGLLVVGRVGGADSSRDGGARCGLAVDRSLSFCLAPDESGCPSRCLHLLPCRCRSHDLLLRPSVQCRVC